MKIWLALFLLLPPLALAAPEEGSETVPPQGINPDAEPEDDIPINWVDTSHTVATNQAQALVEWMDDFFGDPNHDLEQAESLLRLEAINDWDQEDGNDFKLRLRGKVQLPRISKRVNLLFSGEEGNELTEEERKEEDSVSLQLQVREGDRSRFDVTMGWASSSLRPGLRYRNEANITQDTRYRFIQRFQYQDGKNFYATTNLDFNHLLNENEILRWSNRGLYGDHSDGVEWRTSLSLFQRWYADRKRPVAFRYFGSVTGVTRPDAFVKNYRLGIVWRRKVYRDFLFAEIEPAYNYRRRTLDVDREGAWSLVLKLEIALERDLRRLKRDRDEEEEEEEPPEISE